MPRTDFKHPRKPSAADRLGQRRLLQRAVDLLKGGQTSQAEPVLSTILSRWPSQPDALHFLGILEHQRGRSDAAIALIQRAIDGAPEAPDPWNNLGNVLVELQRFDEAVEAYERCLALAPGFTDALNNLSTIYRRRGLHPQSEALCRQVVALRPDLAQGWYNLSLTLLEQGQIEEGLQANSRATLLWPRHLQARNAVPRALVHLGRLDEAAQLYREWLAVDPDNPVIHHHLAACLGGEVPARASDGYVERTFDAFAATFDANLAALGYRAPELVAQLLMQQQPSVAGQATVADLGCGTGLCGPLIRAFAARLIGCDLSAGMLEKAHRRSVYDELCHQELVAFLTARPNTFDALVCADTLCYFGDLLAATHAACGALRPGGVLVFTVEALADADAPSYYLQPHGRYAHSQHYVTTALQSSGLTVCCVRQEVLRLEAGRPVAGWLFAARRA